MEQSPGLEIAATSGTITGHWRDIGGRRTVQRKVNAWKSEVTSFIQTLKKKADEHPHLLLEIRNLKAQIQANAPR